MGSGMRNVGCVACQGCSGGSHQIHSVNDGGAWDAQLVLVTQVGALDTYDMAWAALLGVLCAGREQDSGEGRTPGRERSTTTGSFSSDDRQSRRIGHARLSGEW